MAGLLAVDDEPLVLESLRHLFRRQGQKLRTASSGAEALAAYETDRPDVALVDLRLSDCSGFELFRKFQAIDPKVPVIVITGHATSQTAIEAMQLGAFEYIAKPLDPDELLRAVESATKTSRLMRVPAQIEGEPAKGPADLLVGRSAAMQEVYKAIGRVAAQDVTVLILGESGSGKELVARAIYNYSRRSSGPFLAINCAAIPDSLLESELFGHEKGSFTGADRKRIGKFEQCRHGTLFLDEIGDMSPLTQTKILRVLQEKEFERVGGSEIVRTDVRLIAATNRNLEQAIEAGGFRSDLFYRLNDYTIRIPPLRERPEDLPLLVDHFLQRLGGELNKTIDVVEPRAMEVMAEYSWPGNIRELQSAIKHAVVQATGSVIVVENLPPAVRESATRGRSGVAGNAHQEGAGSTSPPRGDPSFDLAKFVAHRYEQGTTNLYEEAVRNVERSLLLDVLARERNNLTQAARVLGISRTTLRSKLSSHGVTLDRQAIVEPAPSAPGTLDAGSS